jgi:hypothetical protein
VGDDGDDFQNEVPKCIEARQGREDKTEYKRFTFNSNYQDTIKEEDEEEFYKVDYDQIIQLRQSETVLKAENLRLMQESAENMQLFNNYMREMEQRVADKNK